MQVTKRNGTREARDIKKIQRAVAWACAGLDVSQSDLETSAHLTLYDGIKTDDIQKTLIITAADKISEASPQWTYVAARLLLQTLYKHANDGSIEYPHWTTYAQIAISHKLVDAKLADPEWYDLEAINNAIIPERDFTFDYLGLQTLADRYLLRIEEADRIVELPQHLLMRVAMGVASCEATKELRTRYAIAYYNLYSDRRAINSTPTLFNSATMHPQLSSCFGTMIGDSIDGIMDGMKEIAQYSKFSGGCSVDMGGVRSTGSRIGSTRGKAGGPIPYLKLYNDTLIGFDQSGKRKGSGSAYIEPWHADIFRYLDLKEPGDDRLRAHDIFPALWIPDLFMERLEQNGMWSLFDPKVVPQLHETYGEDFEALYLEAERNNLFIEQVSAEDLWYKILERLWTHGVYWPCFKDVINYRYAQPQVVHQSNLCTEITLRNDDEVSFVCNLASVNTAHPAHFLKRDSAGKWLWNSELETTVRLMVRNLDSVITVGTIPHPKGARMQELDRPIGLGIMGWTEALYALGIDYESAEHIEYSNEVLKQISLTAIDESANLAQELGSYPTFHESTWKDGQLPVDSLRHRRVVDKFNLDITTTSAPFGNMDALREKVKKGMRNSTLLAIAPTATIANIIGTTPCTELPWQAIFTKKNLSGTFKYLAQTILNNPKNLPFKSARSINQLWTVWSAAARQIWIDQAQSTNYYVNPEIPDDQIGDTISNMYKEAWMCGCKTSYYLYGNAEEDEVSNTGPLIGSLNGTSAEDLTADANWGGGRVCSIDAGPDCEACQ